MKHPLPRHLRDHPSYQLHRKQVWTQILLPIVLACLLFVSVSVLVYFTSLKANSELGRWAAISTIWLTLPVLLLGSVALITFCALIFLISQLTGLIPTYTYQAQRFVYRINGIARQIDGMAKKPILLIQQIAKVVTAYLGRI
jgi:hypothetical protein